MTIEELVNRATQKYQSMGNHERQKREIELGFKIQDFIAKVADDIGFMIADGSTQDAQAMGDALKAWQCLIHQLHPQMQQSEAPRAGWQLPTEVDLNNR